MVFSLSEADRWSWLSFTSKRKSPRMGRAFLLLMTLDRAVSFELNAVLETVNLIVFFFLVISKIDYKVTLFCEIRKIYG